MGAHCGAIRAPRLSIDSPRYTASLPRYRARRFKVN
jgi:hypothetical protein